MSAPTIRDSDALAVVRSDLECFGCGDPNPIGLRLRFSPVDSGVRAAFVPAPEHQRFHGTVHRGILSSVLDEAMAWATAQAGIWAVTGEMAVRFRQALHVGEQTTVLAKVTEARGRFVSTSAGHMRISDRATIATAAAKFVRVSENVEREWRSRYPETAES